MEYLAYVNQQESKGIPPPPDLASDDLKEWQLYRIDVEHTSALFSRGAHIAVGSPSIAPQGRSFHWALWSLVEIGGLSPNSELMAATITADEGVGVREVIGSLEVGGEAELAVLEKNTIKRRVVEI